MIVVDIVGVLIVMGVELVHRMVVVMTVVVIHW